MASVRTTALLLAASILGSQAAASSVTAITAPLTPVHEAGRCAIRGQCGSKSFFGKQLPCVYNGPAEEPDPAVRESLVSLCGSRWSEGKVCCDADQVSLTDSLVSSVSQSVA